MDIKLFGERVVVFGSPTNEALQSADIGNMLKVEGRYFQIGDIAENKEHWKTL